MFIRDKFPSRGMSTLWCFTLLSSMFILVSIGFLYIRGSDLPIYFRISYFTYFMQLHSLNLYSCSLHAPTPGGAQFSLSRWFFKQITHSRPKMPAIHVHAEFTKSRLNLFQLTIDNTIPSNPISFLNSLSTYN